MKSTTYRFKKGQRPMLDCIYDIQGLGGSEHWWEDVEGTSDDEEIITRDITINIRIWRKDSTA